MRFTEKWKLLKRFFLLHYDFFLQNYRYFSAHLLHFLKIQETRPKKNHQIVRLNIQYDHHSDIKVLGTLYAEFKTLSHDRLIGYRTGDE